MPRNFLDSFLPLCILLMDKQTGDVNAVFASQVTGELHNFLSLIKENLNYSLTEHKEKNSWAFMKKK